MRWACLATFFLALGLGEVCTGDAWNLLSEATGIGGFRLVSPAEGTGALAPVHFNQLHAACACGQTRLRNCTQSAPPPPPQPRRTFGGRCPCCAVAGATGAVRDGGRRCVHAATSSSCSLWPGVSFKSALFSVVPACETLASDMSVACAGTFAWRRRQRRLRSMLRHERQTVAMELAAALHHSRDVGPEKNDGLWAQTAASSGGRPGVLKEPEPQGGAVTVGYVAAPGPLFEVASMAGGDSVDGTALRFLVNRALERQNEEKEERRMKRINAKVSDDIPLSHEEHEAWKRWIVAYASSSSSSGMRRKRKKKRKRKLPKSSSSRSSRGRARRRQRQWHVSGFPGDVPLRAVFPSSVGRPEFPGIMASMDQNDRCSGLFEAGFVGYDALPSLVGRVLGILASIDQKDSYALFLGKAGVACDNAPRDVFSSLVRRPMMLCIMAVMVQNDSCLRRTGKFGLLGDYVVFFYGPCIWKSLVRAFCLRSTGLLLFREMTPGMVSVFSTSWFNSGYVFPGILAGMDQKDSGALIVDSCSDMCKARIAGFTVRCVFPLVVGRPAGRSVWTRTTIMQFGWFYWRRCSSRCAPVLCRQAQDDRHHGRYDSEGQLPRGVPQICFFSGR